jgi:hypothetical protein
MMCILVGLLAIRRDIPGSDGRWGNPLEMDTPREKKDGTREEVIVYHKTWLLLDKECKPDECNGSVPKPKNYSVWQWKFTNKQLKSQLQTELKAKVLGCWCAPLPCHGDTLTELANRVNATNHRTTTVSVLNWIAICALGSIPFHIHIHISHIPVILHDVPHTVSYPSCKRKLDKYR